MATKRAAKVQADPDAMGQRVTYAKELLSAFRLERIIYVTVTLISFVILAIAAVRMIFAPSPNYGLILGTFGSTGAIALTVGRVLAMWNQILKIVFGTDAQS